MFYWIKHSVIPHGLGSGKVHPKPHVRMKPMSQKKKKKAEIQAQKSKIYLMGCKLEL